MAAGHRVGASRAKSEINITPFVDVVLVLLIIFMVVTPMLQRGVDVLLPVTAHHAEKKDTGEQIIISVRRDGAIFLGQDAVDLKLLEARLEALLSRRPAPPVFVKGDRRLTFKPIRQVLEACHRAGAPGAALATQGKKKAGKGT
jgi:biopolymer transport protein ExbD